MRQRILLFCSFLMLSVAVSAFSVYGLTCENEDCPLGLDIQVPRFSWKTYASERSYVQSAYQIMVSERKDELSEDIGRVWDSGKIHSSESVLLPFEGKPLKPSTTYFWKVRVWDSNNKQSSWSQLSTFTTALFTKADWRSAQWIALEEDRKEDYLVPGLHGNRQADDVLKGRKIGLYCLPQFRKQFSANKQVKSAMAYICGLGHFELFMNGKKVGDHFLDAGWTKYDKQALYVSFDVTSHVKRGDNAIGVMLGNGFYNVPRERYFKVLISHGAPKMKMLLKVEYMDGTTEDIISDRSWRVKEGPITYSSIFGGEDYDATREQVGWNSVGFNDANWNNVKLTRYDGALISQRATPLTVRGEMPVVEVYKSVNGEWVYDFGQNFSGIVSLEIKSTKSQRVVLHPGELLNADRTVNQSASGSPFYFSYKTKGTNNVEFWKPQFTYYGFRYLQIEGAVPQGSDNPDQLPEIISVKGLHTANSATESGSFTCSKPMFNQIHSLIDWAMRSNMASVLTDCPHREKLGWLEQAHLMQYSIQYRYDLSRLYEKIVRDMSDSQRTDGCIPTIAPEYVRFSDGFEDTPEWGSAFIISPWYIYKWYGDKRLLQTYYKEMKHYLEYLGTKANNNIVAYGLGDWFDIGPNNPGYAQLTSNGVTATAIYYYNTKIMQEVASLLNQKEDALSFEKLAGEIKKAFKEAYFDPKSRTIERNSQTASAMALYMELVDKDDEVAILNNLVDDIMSRNNTLTAGDVGYRYVLRSLEEHNRSDIIYDMNSKYDVPGYGWQLAHGATALTESWQAYGFVSNNHFMLGHFMEWLYGGLGGIRQTKNSIAFSEVLIDPQYVGDISYARTTYESPFGTIRCDWDRNEKGYLLKVKIPANSKALVVLPTKDISKVTEYGRPLAELSGVIIDHDFSKTKESLSVKVGSGEYQFKIEW